MSRFRGREGTLGLGVERFKTGDSMRVMRAVCCLLVGLVVLSACSGADTTREVIGSEATSASAASVVTRFDVVSRLRPLTAAVVDYTESDYTSGGSSPYGDEVLSAVRANLESVESEERKWLSFTSGIDYEASGVPGLKGAIGEYNASLDAWQVGQEKGLQTWERCVSQYDDELQISVCLVSEYSIDDEKPLLDRYVQSIQQMFTVLGVSSEQTQ